MRGGRPDRGGNGEFFHLLLDLLYRDRVVRSLYVYTPWPTLYSHVGVEHLACFFCYIVPIGDTGNNMDQLIHYQLIFPPSFKIHAREFPLVSTGRSLRLFHSSFSQLNFFFQLQPHVIYLFVCLFDFACVCVRERLHVCMYYLMWNE